MKEIRKIYKMSRDLSVPALREVNLEVCKGEFVAIMGPSGSGKSTLMHIMGCLDRPTSGWYFLNGQDVSNKKSDELARIRNAHIGFVFQAYNLLSQLSAVENVELPLIYRGIGVRERRKKAEEALASVGLAERLRHRPTELSGGQQQRVAIARALVSEPSIILADEPTGNLDSLAEKEIMDVFKRLNQQGITVVLVTHEEEVATYAARVVRLRDGMIVEDQVIDPQNL